MGEFREIKSLETVSINVYLNKRKQKNNLENKVTLQKA